jgi:7,8-dihydro-6-hydroxymethylpterin-pyrophosphokinase
MGPNAGQRFINAAACVETALPPYELLSLLQQIEVESGRTRTVRWGPRTLDLDLLCYGQQEMASDTLVIPHPGIWYRRFVLEPLSEIAAEWQHASLGMSVRDLRKRLECRPLKIEVEAAELPQCPEQYRGQLQLQLPGPDAALTSVAPGVFCRFVTDSNYQDRAGHDPSFILLVRAEELNSMLASIADAALGSCKA